MKQWPFKSDSNLFVHSMCIMCILLHVFLLFLLFYRPGGGGGGQYPEMLDKNVNVSSPQEGIYYNPLTHTVDDFSWAYFYCYFHASKRIVKRTFKTLFYMLETSKSIGSTKIWIIFFFLFYKFYELVHCIIMDNL